MTGRNVMITKLSRRQKLHWFLFAHWRGLTFVLTPFLYSIIFVFADDPIPKHFLCGYTLLVMATFWVTEAIPIVATSLIPMFFFPMSGIMSTTETCFAYMTDTVIMVIISMMLAFAFEASGLHRRMALGIVLLVGYSHARLFFGLTFMTMFISMWVANMATTTMMLPINTAVLEVLEKQGLGNIYYTVEGETYPTLTSQCYYLTAAYSSSIGGIGSLTATPTNLAMKGLFEANYPKAPELINFTRFSMFTIPLMLTMTTGLYFYMNYYFLGMLRPTSARRKELMITPAAKAATRDYVREQWMNLGKITYRELAAGLLFMTAMLLFVTRSPSVVQGWADMISEVMAPKTEGDPKRFIRDSTSGMFITTLMFLVPSSLRIFDYFKEKTRKDFPDGTIPSLIEWKSCEKKFPWEYLLLIGGGFALSQGSQASGLSSKVGDFLKILAPLPHNIILFIVCMFTLLVTNFSSNVAMANILCPVAMELARSVNMNPLLLLLATGLGCSFTFCLPIGTPPNAMIQATCNIRTVEMVKCGAGLSIVSVFVMWFFLSTYIKVIWDVDTVPDWAKS